MGRAMKQSFISVFFFCILFGFSSTAFANDIAGIYLIKGANPGSTETYSGSAILTPNGDGYSFVGTVNNHRYHGVGLYNKEKQILGMTYFNENEVEVGQVMLDVEGNTLKGRWMDAKDKLMRTGWEIWKKQD